MNLIQLNLANFGLFTDLDVKLNLERSNIKGVTEGRTMQSIRSEVQESETRPAHGKSTKIE